MCPDRDLVSAYVDGEVPSPWRERLEEHISSCRDCGARAASYAALGERLREEAPSGESASLARGRERLDALLAAAPRAVEPSALRGPAAGSPFRGAWRRPVSLSLPMAAAAALIAVLLGGAAAMIALKPGKAASIQTVASGELIPQKAQPASMDELLRYLDSSEGQVTLTINLPTGTTFGSAGKPVIMRTGQVVRVAPAGGSSP